MAKETQLDDVIEEGIVEESVEETIEEDDAREGSEPETGAKAGRKAGGAKGGKKAEPASSLTKKERDAIARMPYEEARDRLIEAVRALETGGLSLEQSMHQWEIGEALAARAQSLLNDVRAKLDAAQAEQAATANTAGTQGNLE